jgi:cysteine desulfurase / selenocysteine lyase
MSPTTGVRGAAVAAPAGFDARVVRERFPLLRDHGDTLAYLDSAATSQKPDRVLEAMDRYYRTINANIHRGVYRIAEEATAAYEDARRKVARFVGVTPRELVFTRNSTEAINLVSNAWGRANLERGDVVLLTTMEHHANLVPWHLLAETTGIELRFVPLTPAGELDREAVPGLLADGRVKLFGLVHLSNVLGTLNPVAELAAIAHSAGALVLVDASQSVPHLPVDLHALGADFLAFTAHKMLGPTGIGALAARRELLETMPPFLGGGEMIREVKLGGSKWNELPWKFEAGTMPIAEAIGFGAAVDELGSIGMEHVWAHDRALAGYAMERLGEVPGLRVLGPPADRRGGVVAFTLDGIHPHDIAAVLDTRGVCVRAGHHCAMPLHEALGIAASARASFHCYSLEWEVDALIAGLHETRRTFAR